jgi:hypothetical protein
MNLILSFILMLAWPGERSGVYLSLLLVITILLCEGHYSDPVVFP